MLTKFEVDSFFKLNGKGNLSDDIFSAKDPFGRNILFHALSRNNKELIAYLLSGVMGDRDIFDENNIGVLSSINDVSIHQQFLDKFIPTIKNHPKPFNVIPSAWYGGLLFWKFDSEAQKLIDACVDYKKPFDMGGFVYLEQHFKTGNLKNYKKLLNSSFNYNNYDFSILSLASFYKHWDVVEYLIKDFGLCPNLGSTKEVLYDKTGDRLPLINALRERNFEMAEFLLDNGASANINGLSSSFKLSWQIALRNDAPKYVLEKMLPTGGIIEVGDSGHENFNLFGYPYLMVDFYFRY